MNNNEQEIYLTDFQAIVKDGPVNFVITDVSYGTVKTKQNNEVNVIKVTVEVQELNNSFSEREVKVTNIFINRTSGGECHLFVKAVLGAVQANVFTPSIAVGLKGQALLTHYTPNGSEFSYPKLRNWIFYDSSEDHNVPFEESTDYDLDYQNP